MKGNAESVIELIIFMDVALCMTIFVRSYLSRSLFLIVKSIDKCFSYVCDIRLIEALAGNKPPTTHITHHKKFRTYIHRDNE